MQAPAAPLPPPIGTTIASTAGSSLEHLERVRPDAGDEVAARRPSGRSAGRARRRGASHCSRASSKSRPCSTISAPSARIEPTFAGFAPAGTQIVTPHAEEPAGVGERLAVVSGRGSDQPALALVLRELGDEVHAAADLEGTRRQVVLVLDEHLRAEQPGEPGVRVERRREEVRREPRRGGADVSERRGRHRRRTLACHGEG